MFFYHFYKHEFNNDKNFYIMGVVGENIKHLRKAHQLSQCDLADKVGLKRGNIASYEKSAAEPRIDNVIKLADFFKVTICDFVKKDLSNGNIVESITEEITTKPVLVNDELKRIQEESENFENMINGMKCYHNLRISQIEEHTEHTKMLSNEVERLLSVVDSLMSSHKYLISVIDNHTNCEEE